MGPKCKTRQPPIDITRQYRPRLPILIIAEELGGGGHPVWGRERYPIWWFHPVGGGGNRPALGNGSPYRWKVTLSGGPRGVFTVSGQITLSRVSHPTGGGHPLLGQVTLTGVSGSGGSWTQGSHFFSSDKIS